VSDAATVFGALRTFLPQWLASGPTLSASQQRAIWAITHCRTPSLGGRFFGCHPCRQAHFAYHSCNHKACPQCGKTATAHWVKRELNKRLNAPYFLVTFTLPAPLRSCFFGPLAKEAFDLFFAAVSGALAEKLATDKGLRAHVNGFTAVLHTWNQHLQFHPHIHCLVPGAGLNSRGQLVRVKQPDFLVHLPHLQAAFRQHLGRLLHQKGWQVDPDVWNQNWGVHIRPAGGGASALKYLGAYVARTAIADSRILRLTDTHVVFWWKDRDRNNRREILSLPGTEFVARYLRHVLPPGLRSIRYYGFCHPAAKANRWRLQLHTGAPVDWGAANSSADGPPWPVPCCPKCGKPMQLLLRLPPRHHSQRGPPFGGRLGPLQPLQAA
jgi:hypothetical protein